MEPSRFERAAGIVPTEIDLLEVFGSPVKPLVEARIRLSRAPAHIKFCLKQTLEDDERLLHSVLSKMNSRGNYVRKITDDLDEICFELLRHITAAWDPHGAYSRRSSSQPNDIVTFTPERLPDAFQSFREQLKRYDVPISDLMELAMTEAHRNAMLVLLEDNRLLARVAEAYNNNPNFRHEVGRLTAIMRNRA